MRKTFDPALGYLFASAEHGVYSPNAGRVDMTPEQVAEHNAELARVELASMEATGRAVLYLVRAADGTHEIINWLGTLRFSPWRMRQGRHNIARRRTDVWFRDTSGASWHGVQYGENTQIVRCRRLAK